MRISSIYSGLGGLNL